MSGLNPELAAHVDASEHAIRLLARENKILEFIARGASLEKVLTEIAHAAEEYCDTEVRCSILLLDESGTRLMHGAAPSLPDTYNKLIHGTAIGPEVGSCGKAAFCKKPVFVEDIDTAPSWSALKHLALPLGLRGAWSMPIFASNGDVLGTLGIYTLEPASPTDRARQAIDLLARTAGIAIERHRSESQRLRYQKQIETLNDTGILLAAERDLHKIVQAATDTAREFSGAAFGAFFYNEIRADGESYMLYTLSGAPREAFEKFPMPRNTAVFGPTFAGEGTVRLADVRKDPRYGKNAPYHGMPEGHLPVCSYLAVPVVSRSGKVLGGLFFGHSEPNRFTLEAQHLVESIAAQAAAAIDNAQLNDRIARQLASSEEVQQRLAIAQQAAQLATWELDFRTDEIRFSPGSWPVFGCDPSEIKSRADWERQIHPDDRDIVRNELESCVQNAKAYFVEYRVQSPLGVRWVQGRGHVVYHAETARPERLIVLSIDITERKLADEALRISDQKFREAQKAANMGTWFWDIPTDKVTWSMEVPSFDAAVSADRLKNWVNAVHPDDRPAVVAELDRALRQGGPFKIEHRLIRQDGAQRWSFTQGQIMLGEDGTALSGLGITMDTTARREAETELKRAEERFNLAVDAADLGFWYCDLPFDVLGWDERVKEHFWLPPDAKVTVDDFYRILHPEDRERTRQAIETSINQKKRYDVDHRAVSPTGEVRWVRAVGRGFYDETGNPVRFDGVTMDITERRKAEEALRSSEKLAATGRLAATIAHEINNPLEAVTNFIYLAKTTDGVSDQVRSYLEIADQELGRVSHIARQTLGFYRDSSGPILMSVPDIVQDVVNLYQRKLLYKSLELKLDVQSDLTIRGLAGEMRQVLANLLVNAIDASNDGGRIWIRARRVVDLKTGGKAVRLTVGDSGIGMNEEVRKKLFTPFFTTKSDVGTGLGLWVTRGMVEKAKGRIRVRSRQGIGTVFSMLFPSTKYPPPSVQPA
ncbi:multi-sensor signal transduction histidine kinase [Candidatus Koribacter versatilis Ellin345]|uniref:histidine kinase n=1 Tax=Koribacter versatilis (strain Ellin345) TaxID=204669 RepID=Q1IKT0_KORVE|nr:PAS domain-containing protein [Candidatus Koribacter versatilis]ABF42520.1 multi-sensor signal transduction histidine kinase [Candidatus Koribacter versatilis Ellin345]